MNNKGFSLIELIVTIGILAAITGSLIWSTSFLEAGNTRKCAEQIDALLGKARIETMSKSDDYSLVIYQDAEKYYARITSTPLTDTTKGTELGSHKIKIYYRVEGEASDRQVLGAAQLVLQFDKSTGAFKPPAVGGIVTYINIKTTAGGTGRYVYLVGTTGKHYVK